MAHCIKERNHFTDSGKMSCDFADYNYQLAKYFYREGDFSKSVQYIEKALNKNSDYLLALMLRIKIYTEQGDFSLASREFSKFRLHYDKYADVIYLSALILYFSKNYIEALSEIRRALEINNLYHDAYMLELIIYHRVGRIKELYDLRKKLASNDVSNTPEQYFYNGLLAYERRHWASGIISFESANVLGYDSKLCSYNSACLYAFFKDYQKTQELLKKIVSENKEYISYIENDDDLKEFRKTDLYLTI